MRLNATVHNTAFRHASLRRALAILNANKTNCNCVPLIETIRVDTYQSKLRFVYIRLCDYFFFSSFNYKCDARGSKNYIRNVEDYYTERNVKCKITAINHRIELGVGKRAKRMILYATYIISLCARESLFSPAYIFARYKSLVYESHYLLSYKVPLNNPMGRAAFATTRSANDNRFYK